MRINGTCIKLYQLLGWTTVAIVFQQSSLLYAHSDEVQRFSPIGWIFEQYLVLAMALSCGVIVLSAVRMCTQQRTTALFVLLPPELLAIYSSATFLLYFYLWAAVLSLLSLVVMLSAAWSMERYKVMMVIPISLQLTLALSFIANSYLNVGN